MVILSRGVFSHSGKKWELRIHHPVIRAMAGDRTALILFTNSGLLPAIHLYHKYGFADVPLIDNEYEESDMKMELIL